MAQMTELRKALLTAAGQTALNPVDIEPYIAEELLKLQPLAQIVEMVQAEGPTHEYRLRTSHPQAWFEGENTPANPSSGGYDRKTVALKIQRIWGGVTGFAQTVNAKFINSLALEIEGAVQGMADVFEYGIMYGAANDIGFTGDAYQYSGLFPRVYAYAPANVVDAGGNKVTLDDLDSLIEVAQKHRQTKSDPYLFMMGQKMKLVVDGLQTKVQMPITTAELADGRITMGAYGKKPIFESDLLVPASSTSSPALTSALASGGTLTDATAFQHQIASITADGEQVASALSTARTTGTPNFSVALSWTADANAKAYMIFRKTGGGTAQLIDIIAAKTYDANGTVNGTVASYTDTGAKTPISTVKPLASGEQAIALLNLNPERGVAWVGMVDEMGERIENMVSYVELARAKDSYDFMLKSYLAARLKYPNLVGVLRHVTTA